VQDNVVARVLLEHVGGAFHQSDPRRAVNYLDLSRLGEEGETPASDEIWLSVAGGGEDDKVPPKMRLFLKARPFFLTKQIFYLFYKIVWLFGSVAKIW
jgi:hypothetical protein